MPPVLLLLLLQSAAPTPTPTPAPQPTAREDIVVEATAPVTPVPLTAPACLAVAGQLVRVADGARVLLAARTDTGSSDPRAQAIRGDWQHRIDAVEQSITAIRVAYPIGEADAALYPGLRALPTAALLHEGERCAVRPGAGTLPPR